MSKDFQVYSRLFKYPTSASYELGRECPLACQVERAPGSPDTEAKHLRNIKMSIFKRSMDDLDVIAIDIEQCSNGGAHLK